jgi:hypothetical protein
MVNKMWLKQPRLASRRLFRSHEPQHFINHHFEDGDEEFGQQEDIHVAS